MTAWIYAYERISMYLHLEGLNCRWLLETHRANGVNTVL